MIKVRQIKIDVNKDSKSYLRKKVIEKLKIKDEELISFKINKRSIDARDKEKIFYVYEVILKLVNEEKVLKKNKKLDISKVEDIPYKIEVTGKEELNGKIVIVGSGPAGLFSAYILSSLGYKVLVIERGQKIEDRVKSVEEFFETGKLNINSNVQFGEGGAGTFSDGKLNTLVKDKLKRGKKVLEIFVENGAPEEILYENKPHIGTDLLREVIINMRNNIIKMNGEFRYNTILTNLTISDNKLKQIEVNFNEKISCENLILAIGHSARDTFKMLYDNSIKMSPKPFAVGIRIMHPRIMIDEDQYGKNSKLSSASYKLTYQTKDKRGVYSFCMCPGGYVVNASSEENRLVVNGMSNYKRDSKTSNSAAVVSVGPKDYGDSIFDGINFQRKLEEKSYAIGKGKIPIQLYKDYKENKISSSLGEVSLEIKGDYNFANINDIFPEFINDSLKEAIDSFDNKLKGFARADAIIAGVESRTSSPIRIERDSNLCSNILGIYPIGEGAGYAGGITTSAIDGIKVAEIFASKYRHD